MNSELHLFIIWANARYKQSEIIKDISSRFRIVGIHSITWDKSRFSGNITRFYGENLPPYSNKVKLCGNDTFVLVTVIDENPLYRPRLTSKGSKSVNVNMFDSKEMYRLWTGGGHMIHGTNDEKETRHDLVLLTGYSVDDYLKMATENGAILEQSFFEMPGEDKWKEVKQLFYVLNETIPYVVLRNFDDLFSPDNHSLHADIDILTDNRDLARLMINGKPVFRSERRVRHRVNTEKEVCYFDIRYVGDDYYCKKWEEDILNSKVYDQSGFYRPSETNYYFSLLYHALVQKTFIAEDYKNKFKSFFSELDEDALRDTLLEYLKQNHYSMNEPVDYSVYFNPQITGKSMSLVKFCNKAVHCLFSSSK